MHRALRIVKSRARRNFCHEVASGECYGDSSCIRVSHRRGKEVYDDDMQCEMQTTRNTMLLPSFRLPQRTHIRDC